MGAEEVATVVAGAGEEEESPPVAVAGKDELEARPAAAAAAAAGPDPDADAVAAAAAAASPKGVCSPEFAIGNGARRRVCVAGVGAKGEGTRAEEGLGRARVCEKWHGGENGSERLGARYLLRLLRDLCVR